jgi:hypothetical protein
VKAAMLFIVMSGVKWDRDLGRKFESGVSKKKKKES